MSNTKELPTDLDTGLALKYIPIIELNENFSNFEEWEHSIRFYLRYHDLLEFIEGEHISRGFSSYGYYNSEGPSVWIRDPTLHRRLLVYSLIWKSAVAVFRQSPLNKDLKKELYENREHEPEILWKLLHAHYQSIRDSTPQASPETGKSARQ